jgi:hypothetical protein
VTPQEKSTLESIRVAMGAKKGVYSSAFSAAESPSYTALPVGTFATKVANLEDMVRVALSDGDLSDTEKFELEGFADAIGIAKVQLGLVQSELIAELGSASIQAACGACVASLAEHARFCATCGSAAASDGATVVS